MSEAKSEGPMLRALREIRRGAGAGRLGERRPEGVRVIIGLGGSSDEDVAPALDDLDDDEEEV
jgi:hypothetical protein